MEQGPTSYRSHAGRLLCQRKPGLFRWAPQVQSPQPRADIKIDAGASDNQFSIIYTDKGTGEALEQTWVLTADDTRKAVRMEITDAQGNMTCPLYWRREAAQFRATRSDECDNSEADSPSELVLSTHNCGGGAQRPKRRTSFIARVSLPVTPTCRGWRGSG